MNFAAVVVTHGPIKGCVIVFEWLCPRDGLVLACHVDGFRWLVVIVVESCWSGNVVPRSTLIDQRFCGCHAGSSFCHGLPSEFLRLLAILGEVSFLAAVIALDLSLLSGAQIHRSSVVTACGGSVWFPVVAPGLPGLLVSFSCVSFGTGVRT